MVHHRNTRTKSSTATEAPRCPMSKKPSNATGSQSPRRSPGDGSVQPVVALSPSIAQASRDTGVSERTLRRWLDDPAFREQLSQLHHESYDLARRQLQALVPHLVSVLAKEAIENPDPSIRIRAARYAMNYAVRFHDVDNLTDDLRDLRAALLKGK